MTSGNAPGFAQEIVGGEATPVLGRSGSFRISRPWRCRQVHASLNVDVIEPSVAFAARARREVSPSRDDRPRLLSWPSRRSSVRSVGTRWAFTSIWMTAFARRRSSRSCPWPTLATLATHGWVGIGPTVVRGRTTSPRVHPVEPGAQRGLTRRWEAGDLAFGGMPVDTRLPACHRRRRRAHRSSRKRLCRVSTGEAGRAAHQRLRVEAAGKRVRPNRARKAGAHRRMASEKSSRPRSRPLPCTPA